MLTDFKIACIVIDWHNFLKISLNLSHENFKSAYSWSYVGAEIV